MPKKSSRKAAARRPVARSKSPASRSKTGARTTAAVPRRRAPVLVLGMHRGGTSLATGLLQTLGAELGSPLIASNEGNPLGYFEHKAIVACHDRILASLGLDWHSPDVLVFPREGTEPRLAE